MEIGIIIICLFLLLSTFVLYFVPAFIAYVRGHKQVMAIIVLNILGGWTAIGWIAALVWAFTNDIKR